MYYTELQLAKILNKMYLDAPNGETIAMIHLFGIMFGELIKENNYSITKIVKLSKINESYKTEVNKGVNLSKYVELKAKHEQYIADFLGDLI